MHGNHIGRVRLQPAVQLVLGRNVDGQEARVALVVAVVRRVFAVILGPPAADEVDARPFGRLQQLGPQLGAPAHDLGDGVAEGHVAQRAVLGAGADGQGGEHEGGDADHDGRGKSAQ